MGDAKLAEKFIEQRLGHDAVAEFRAYMKEARRAERKKQRDHELNLKNPHIIELKVVVDYMYGGDFVFELGDEYTTSESLREYLREAVGLDISETYQKGYYKIESTCKYFTTCCHNRYYHHINYTPDDIVNDIWKVIQNGTEKGNTYVCPMGSYRHDYKGVPEIKYRRLYSSDEVKAYFKRCYFRVSSLHFFVPEE